MAKPGSLTQRETLYVHLPVMQEEKKETDLHFQDYIDAEGVHGTPYECQSHVSPFAIRACQNIPIDNKRLCTAGFSLDGESSCLYDIDTTE